MAERLAWARARAARTMTDAAAIRRQTHTQDPDGNDVVVTTTLGPVPCRLESNTALPLERPEGGVLTAVTIWQAHLPHGTDVRPDDTLTINGETYQVSDQTDARTDAVDTLVLLRRAK